MIERRTLLRSAAALAAATSLGGAALAAPARPPKRPNILFIMADDMGYGDLSSYGRPDCRTPVLDKLAADGVKMMQAYANSAVCSATRTALITGRYQYRLPIGLEEPLTVRDVGLEPSVPTLPGMLREAGYRTSLIGKWHLGQMPRYGPLQSGYDRFWGVRGGAVDYFTHNGRGEPDLWDGDRRITAKGYFTDLLADQAIAEIRTSQAARKPFYMSLHFTAPHWPWEGPDDEAEARRIAGKPGGDTHYDGGSMATYAAMMTRMDMQIGRILKELERAGIADDTIVVFTSDNGGERYSYTWPYEGRKNELLEGGIRVPGIVRYGRRIPRGQVSQQVSISMDWVPTLLSFAGVDPQAAVSDGIDISAQLMGRSPVVPRTLFWRFLNMNQRASRHGNWKYLRIAGNSFLFDLSTDPQEKANLKDRRRKIFADLERRYDAWEATMLPLDPEAASGHSTGKEIASEFGVQPRRERGSRGPARE